MTAHWLIQSEFLFHKQHCDEAIISWPGRAQCTVVRIGHYTEVTPQPRRFLMWNSFGSSIFKWALPYKVAALIGWAHSIILLRHTLWEWKVNSKNPYLNQFSFMPSKCWFSTMAGARFSLWLLHLLNLGAYTQKQYYTSNPCLLLRKHGVNIYLYYGKLLLRTIIISFYKWRNRDFSISSRII